MNPAPRYAALILTLVPAAGHAAPSSLFYLEETDATHCVARTLELPSKVERTVFVAGTCPIAIAWDAVGRRELFIAGDRLWEHRAGAAATEVTPLAKLPGPASAWTDTGTGKLWVDGRGTARVAYLFDAEEAGLPIETAKPQGASGKFVRYDGERLELLGAEAPYITACEVLEGTRWRRAEVKPTTWAFDVAMGFSALDCYRKAERGANLDDLLTDATCGTRLDCTVEPDAATKARVLAQDPAAVNLMYSALRTAAGSRFLYAVIEGDNLHPAPPIYFCTGACEKLARLTEVTDDAVSLSVNGDYVVIATEYENGHPRIYDIANGRLVHELPKARSAVWLPHQANH